nr:uncharacterized protein LOC111415346 isoform X1 [Onthophagus taurus]
MESTYIVETHNCPFIGIETDDVYSCFRNEACCEGGCCPKPYLTTFRMCYVWLTIAAVLFVCSGGLKLCKSRRRLTQNRFLNQNNTPNNQDVHEIANLQLYLNNPPPRLSNLDEQINLRNLLGSTDACHIAIDRYIACRNARTRLNACSNLPPPYNSVGAKETSCDPFDPPPHYSTLVSDSSAPKTNVPEVQNPHSEIRSEIGLEQVNPHDLERDGDKNCNNNEYV